MELENFANKEKELLPEGIPFCFVQLNPCCHTRQKMRTRQIMPIAAFQIWLPRATFN
jgi:hypothetical protein